MDPTCVVDHLGAQGREVAVVAAKSVGQVRSTLEEQRFCEPVGGTIRPYLLCRAHHPSCMVVEEEGGAQGVLRVDRGDGATRPG